jgi:phosphatidylserine/phosphatidylglycerophosphate/cardiolipin synthase-like enzyme
MLPGCYVRSSGLWFELMNPPASVPAPIHPPKQLPLVNPDVSVQVLRSFGPWKQDSIFPFCRKHWIHLPNEGVQEIHACLKNAFQSASRYIYIEDQYLGEQPAGWHRYELYSHLRDAAARGARVIFVGSGTRNPADYGPSEINRTLNSDIQSKIVDRLPTSAQNNVVVYRVEHLKVHTKLILVDDVFACIGSANLFSRSMAGIDHELSVAGVTTGKFVRDLRMRLWAEHLRTSIDDPDFQAALEDLETAMGIWRSEWLPSNRPKETWRQPGLPRGYVPIENVLTLVGPK